MKHVTIAFLLLLTASAGRAQDTASISYYQLSGNHPLLHFPRIHYIGTDTFAITGLAERFTSPFPMTYLDSVDIGFSLPRFNDVPGNDYEIRIMGSKLDSTGRFLIADTSNVLYRFRHHPTTSEISSAHWERLHVPHIAVDSAFFVVFALTDTNAANIELGIGIDSITSFAQRPVEDNLDRTREYGLGSQQFYIAGNHFTDLGPTPLFWYSNAMFIAHVSDGNSDVSQLTPGGLSLKSIFPNPASKRIAVNYTLSTPEPVSIQLFNEAGVLVQTAQHTIQNAGGHQQEMDISSLAAGSYRCLLIAGGAHLSTEFSVIH